MPSTRSVVFDDGDRIRSVLSSDQASDKRDDTKEPCRGYKDLSGGCA